MQQVVPNSHMKAPSLSLDHELVLSAWEQIGGDIFLGDDFDLGPVSIDIDLSSIEASLKQSSSASLDKFSNITPVPNLFPSIPDFSFPPPNFGVPDADIKGQEKSMHWQQQCLGVNNSTPASVSKCPPPQVKIEATAQDPQGSCSSLSSNSADIAIVPEVTSHPAARSAQTGSSIHSIPQPFVPNLLPPVGPSLMAPVKQMDSEVWRTRKECLERYKEKKARRMYTKKIRYQLRKINADKRPRIKGRFVKKEELDEYMKTQPSKAATIAEEDECSEVDEDEEAMSEGL